jgi:hypothetical protein
LAFAGAASGLGDDDLEDAGQRDSPELGDLGRDGVGLGDGGGGGGGMAVCQLQGEPVSAPRAASARP